MAARLAGSCLISCLVIFQDQVKMTKIGAISAPLQRDGLIILVRNEGRRQDGVADPSQDIITLARVVYPLAKGRQQRRQTGSRSKA